MIAAAPFLTSGRENWHTDRHESDATEVRFQRPSAGHNMYGPIRNNEIKQQLNVHNLSEKETVTNMQ
jgi:hypothetical protein